MPLAQLNIARRRFPIESPEMATFMVQIADVNAAAEAADGFIWAAGISAVLAGVLACAGRDLLRIDVHLLSGLAAPLAVMSALGNVTGVGLASVVIVAAALVLPWTFAELVAARGERDPRALGGLDLLGHLDWGRWRGRGRLRSRNAW